jgi:hypothetical protein
MKTLLTQLVALMAALLLAGCASEPAKPKVEPPAIPRVATVGHIAEVKTRGMTSSNWLGSLTDLYKNEEGKNVASVVWEITVFYEDHTQGVVSLPERPTNIRIGQRVLVTGNKIEPAPR